MRTPVAARAYPPAGIHLDPTSHRPYIFALIKGCKQYQTHPPEERISFYAMQKSALQASPPHDFASAMTIQLLEDKPAPVAQLPSASPSKRVNPHISGLMSLAVPGQKEVSVASRA